MECHQHQMFRTCICMVLLVLNFTIVAFDPIDIVATSNYVVVASNFVDVEMQQLVVVQAQAIAWKPHN